MSSLNDPNNFAGRVNYAAKIISAGKGTGRAFDNCFENCDGDVVAVALARRAENNPKLAANLYRFLSRDIVAGNIAEYADTPTRDLPRAAAACRAAIKARWAAADAAREARTNA
jgi:pyruvoyl-dependent arginine decarboxylase (PvlArgDC)